MNETLFAVTGRPSKMVGYEEELEIIKEAILDSGATCHIVVIRGEGGLGKTRLLDEVLNRLGHQETRERYGKPEETWSAGQIVFTDPLDFAEARLLAREYFIGRLGDPRCWSGGGTDRPPLFDNYQNEQFKLKQLGMIGASLAAMHRATEVAEEAFWQDYRAIAAERRPVLILDTAEHLALNASKWMLDNQLLTEEDLVYYTRQWLVSHIRESHFARSTILLAGRAEQGKEFFKLLDELAAAAPDGIKIHEIGAHHLSLDGTGKFFRILRDDWQKREGRKAQTIVANLEYLLNQPEHLEALWLYTGGQPVRLSMYADLLVSPETMPPPRLLDPVADVRQRMKDDEEKVKAQKEIEKDFVRLLFRHGGDLRARIMRLLVRTMPGLTAEEIHYVLDSDAQSSPEKWQPNSDRLEEISKALDEIRDYTLIRRKGNGHIGLQDEVYRIYTNCMIASKDEKEREKEERRQQYEKLYKWTEYRWTKLSEERAHYIEEALNQIPIPPPEQLRTYARLRELTEPEREIRQKLEDDLFQYELDYLYYAFVLNPNEQINEVYVRLASREELALTLENAAVIQAVVNRVLYDEPALPFLDIPSRTAIKERGEQPIDVLRRVAQQYDAAQWILRQRVHGDYERAVELAGAIEEKVAELEDEHERASWSHPLARAERMWSREHAVILEGRDIPGAIDRLEKQIEYLEKLSTVTQSKLIEIEGQAVRGFRGEPGQPNHPGYSRLLFTLANIHNSIGYGQATLGDFRKAAVNYGKALRYFRITELPAQQTTTMNNLSRALVEMGKKRAIRVCLDGLWLKVKKLGRLYSVALSYNTLGLILNDLGQPYEALGALARALAIANEMKEPRLLGLVYIQAGEALRRLIGTKTTVPDFSDYQGFAAGRISHQVGLARQVEMRPDTIYSEAEWMLNNARKIFGAPSGKPDQHKELPRLIEVYIEMGCLYRDWTTHLRREGKQNERKAKDHHGNALHFLREAVRLAHGNQLWRLELDARVNMAWTHFRTNDYKEAEVQLQEAEALIRRIGDGALLREGGELPRPDEYPPYLFAQLSKLWGLRGRMAFEAFKARQDAWKEGHPLDKKERQIEFGRDGEAQEHLRQAAEAYMLALAYAELFSPRSQALSLNYDDLYNYVKHLNPKEIEFFYKAHRAASTTYHTEALESHGMGNMKTFLLDCFGDFYPGDGAARTD